MSYFEDWTKHSETVENEADYKAYGDLRWFPRGYSYKPY